MKEVKLSNLQLGLLIFLTFYGTTAIYNPVISARRDAWIAIIFSLVGGLIPVTICLYISKWNSGLVLTEILERCFGKIFGRIIALFYVIFYIYRTSMNTRIYEDFLVSTNYTETPIIFLTIVYIGAILFVTRQGLSVYGRLSEVATPILLLFTLILSASFFQDSDFIRFKPILEEFTPILKSTIRTISIIFGDIYLFLMIIPYTNNEKGRFKAVYLSTLTFGIILMINTLRNIMAVGSDLLGTVQYSSHIAAQLIPTLNIDPLIDASLLIGTGAKASVLSYVSVKMLSDIFQLKDYRPLVSAFCVLIVVLSFWIIPQNPLDFIHWTESFGDALLAFPIDILFPVLMLIISAIKNRKNASSNQKTLLAE